jgi:single-strand DNA-binding protein
MLNKVIIMGRLCADPELRNTQSGVPVCRIRVAVNRPYRKDQEQQADFINCTAWRTSAEFIARNFTRGKMIIVEGSLRNNDFTDNNGTKHYGMDVLVDAVSFGESKGGGTQQAAPSGNYQQARQQAPQAAPAQDQGLNIANLGDFEEILSDGEVPF